MLHINQIEKPRCSAKIEKIRLRRAMVLPLVSQNFSSSGFQSDIQLGSRVLIGDYPFLSAGETAAMGAAGRRTPKSGESYASQPGRVSRWTCFGPRSCLGGRTARGGCPAFGADPSPFIASH